MVTEKYYSLAQPLHVVRYRRPPLDNGQYGASLCAIGKRWCSPCVELVLLHLTFGGLEQWLPQKTNIESK